MKKHLVVLFILSSILFSCQKQEDTLISKVDPFIGTGGHGHTYPGATTPFGMVQLSPDTHIDDWDACSGYHYSDSHILGFSHTHLSGTGVADLGDIRLMPTVGELKLRPGNKDNYEGYSSKFSHDTEIAKPGFYQVFLEDYNIEVQLTASRRVGFHQYTFPKSTEAHIILDLKESVLTETIHDLQITIQDQHTVTGLRRSGSWAKDQYCYFVMEFSKDFKASGIQSDGKAQDTKEVHGKDLQAWFDFDTSEGEKIFVKVGLSAVSVEGAKKNLEAEIPHWDFQKTLKETQAEWEKELSRIKVKGAPQDETIFYTSLYHSLVAPNTWSDADGQYRGHDLKIHHADHTVYTVFSLWDTFRAEHPLLTILHPERVNDMIKSMLLMEEYGELLPVWELAANETNCMIGYHSIPVIYDAYAKGIHGFDANKALDAMIKSATQDIFGLDTYKKYGYVKADEEGESVSKTLAYAYDDWCIAIMAKDLGRDEVYQEFIKRAQYYKNLFDPSTGFMRAKLNGEWQKPFSATEVNFHFTEANSYQYSMFVPQDINGLIAMHGGDANFDKKLDDLFETEMTLSGRHQSDITGLIGQYAHGNEPSHHMAYLYNYVGKPWKSQKVLSQIMNDLYHDQPDGLSGNEDCGQMSAWYVLSSMGFYPVTPGSNDYILGTPIFEDVVVTLPNQKTLEISAKNYSKKNIYVQSVKLNGQAFSKSFITHQTLMAGGKIEFTMGAEPNKDFGKDEADRPVRKITAASICPAPTVYSWNQTFAKKAEIMMSAPLKNTEIYYTTDGSQPSRESTKYNREFLISKTTNFKVIAYHPDFGYSPVIESVFYKIDLNSSIEYHCKYSELYAAGGDLALINKIRGTDNFKTGAWQGFNNEDFEVVISFEKKKRIHQIAIGFIQEYSSWIFFPSELEFYTSKDKKDWKLVGNITNEIDQKDAPLTHDFAVNFRPQKVKYVKIKAKNPGPCPPWHIAAGSPSWIFADEIIIE